jgi:hypothetical protein
LVTLELAADSPIRTMPWIITFGPLSDEEDWEPVVCGPYEWAHAIALAEEVVADDELMAVVEPMLGFTSPDEIRAEIAAAKATAAAVADLENDLDIEMDSDDDLEFDDDTIDPADPDDDHEIAALPTPAEIRAGMSRVAHKLAESS